MRVALCYRGHFYRETKNLQESFRGDGNSYFLNFANHRENLIDCYEDVDIFFHTYHPRNISNDMSPDDLVEKLKHLTKPKNYKIDTDDNKNIRYSILEVNKLFNKTDYDFVINTRFDLHFKKKITEFEIDYNKFNFLWKEYNKRCPRISKTHITYRCSDLMWAFNSKYTDVFSESYGEMYDKMFGRKNPKRDGHTILKCMNDLMNIDEYVNIISERDYLSGMQIQNPYVDINRNIK